MPVDDTFTKALLHFDGSDGSTTFTDESGKTWTPTGNAQIDTAQFKFGQSGLFDGTTDTLTTPDHDDFDFGSGNFTIDWWQRRNSSFSGHHIAQLTGAGFAPISIFSNSGQLELYMSSNNSSWNLINGALLHTPTNGVWYHYAIVRNGVNIMRFIDGTQIQTSTDISTTALFNSTAVFAISQAGTFNGHIDEFRVSKGIARWTANFTPPTEAYAPLAGFFPFF